VNIPPRGKSSPLEARGEVKNGPLGRGQPEVLPLLSDTVAVWLLKPDPCTDSSLDFQYTVEMVAVHLSFMSPREKCCGVTCGNKSRVYHTCCGRLSEPVAACYSEPRINL
jgi:hypothetical protein